MNDLRNGSNDATPVSDSSLRPTEDKKKKRNRGGSVDGNTQNNKTGMIDPAKGKQDPEYAQSNMTEFENAFAHKWLPQIKGSTIPWKLAGTARTIVNEGTTYQYTYDGAAKKQWGLMRFNLEPSIGHTINDWDSVAPGTIAGLSAYTKALMTRTSGIPATPADFGCYIYGIRDIIAVTATIHRMLKTAVLRESEPDNLFAQKRALLGLLGMSSNQIQSIVEGVGSTYGSTLQNYIAQFNTILTDIRSMLIPALFPLYKRTWTLYSNIFKETDDSGNTVFYAFVSNAAYQIDWVNADLTKHARAMGNDFSSKNAGRYFDTPDEMTRAFTGTRLWREGLSNDNIGQLLSKLRSMVNAMLYDNGNGVDDAATFRALLAKSYTKVFEFPEWTVGKETTYDEILVDSLEIHDMIHNLRIVDGLNLGSIEWNPSTGQLEQAYGGGGAHMYDLNWPIMWDFDNGTVTPEKMYEASTLSAMLDPETGKLSCGTELCVSAQVFNVDGGNFVHSQLHFRNFYDVDTVDWSVVLAACTFKWRPISWYFRKETVGTTTTYTLLGTDYDLDNYALVNVLDLDYMHYVTARSYVFANKIDVFYE